MASAGVNVSGTYYIASGGGSANASASSGGGGAHAYNGTAGSSNTGGGGGGSAANGMANSFGIGGSGIVIVRYADSNAAASATTGSPTVIVTGGYRIYKFTASGSITF
jgi:hypothetical protein